MMPTLDPLLTHLAAASVALVLLVSAAQKWRDLGAFEDALADYALLPVPWLGPTARLLPATETAAGLGLLFVQLRSFGALLAGAVLALVTGAIVINLLRGRADIDCGCGGFEDEQHLSWALVARNAVLLLLVGASVAAAPARSLSWLDYLSLVAGAASLFGLYVLTNQLLANQPRLARLRGRR